MTERLIKLLMIVCVGNAAAAQATFCDGVKALTQEPDVAGAHWGIAVTTLDGGELCGVNEAQLFRPASNAKLFTGAVTLALLGADRHFETRVEAVGELTGGVLHGRLELVGGGDANFGSRDVPYVAPAQKPKASVAKPDTLADIEELADKVYAKGIKKIEGDVVGDDSQFVWDPYPPNWEMDDLLWGYGAPVSALSVHDNQVVYSVGPGPRGGGKAMVTAVPDVPYYTAAASVSLGDIGGDCDERIGYRRAAGSKVLEVFGKVPPGGQPCRQSIAVADPAEFGAIALKDALERRGVRVSGAARARHAEMRKVAEVTLEQGSVSLLLKDALSRPYETKRPELGCEPEIVAGNSPEEKRTVLATHESPRLVEDLTYTFKVSQNLHAEIMLRNLGAAFSCEHTQSAGLAVIREYMLHAGLDAKDFKLYDGSGLSGHDLVTPRAVAKFLAYVATQPWFASYKAALPVAGVDGSLSGRFATANSALRGKVYAKTGTLGESRALSGYVTAASGQTLIFSVLVDNHLPGTSADRAVTDRIVELIAAAN